MTDRRNFLFLCDNCEKVFGCRVMVGKKITFTDSCVKCKFNGHKLCTANRMKKTPIVLLCRDCWIVINMMAFGYKPSTVVFTDEDDKALQSSAIDDLEDGWDDPDDE